MLNISVGATCAEFHQGFQQAKFASQVHVSLAGCDGEESHPSSRDCAQFCKYEKIEERHQLSLHT
jgi:hypothetical protein